MSHSFDKSANCQCARCIRERARRSAQRGGVVAPTRKRVAKQKPRYIDPLDQGDNLGESPDY